jgi:hypothetical protein
VLAYFFNRVAMKVVLTALGFFFAFTGHAQFDGSGPQPLPSISIKATTSGTLISMLDKDGKPFSAYNLDVQGSPFFLDKWVTVNLQLANGKVFRGVRARLNIMDNLLHFIGGKVGGVEMYIEAAKIGRIDILDSLKKDSVLLSVVRLTSTQNGIDESYFYEVVSERKIFLLKRLQKKIREYKNDYSNEKTRAYEQYELYYVFAANQLSELKRKESWWQPLMQDKWPQVKAYAAESNGGFKSFAEIAKMVKYYNSLF